MSEEVVTSVKPRIYQLKEILNIKNAGFHFEISEEVIKIINLLANEVGAPSYVRTPQFNKKTGYKRRRKQRVQEISDDDWEAIRNFQATERIEREGLDKLISNLRAALNKITDKTYESQKKLIMSTLDEINKNSEFSEEDNLNVSKTIFEIASSNKFYSKIYATLFKEILSTFDVFKVVFHSKFDSFTQLFKEIESADPNKDYDKFCLVNKANENRKALSMFFSNLMNESVISVKDIEDIVLILQNSLLQFIEEENRKDEVDQISENLFIFILNSKEKLKESDSWSGIFECVETVSNMSVKKYKSLTNKSVFKHLDIMDEIN